MKKLGLLPRLIIAIIIGILIGSFGPQWSVRVLATFNGIFGNFLGFAIPLIIIGFVAPGIGDLGDGAGKLLAITAGIAYGSTILSGSFAYLAGSIILPTFLKSGSLSLNAANPEEALLTGFFTVEMPPIFDVMTALLLAFTLGLGIAAIKGDTLKKFMNDFQEIIEKLINSIVIPLLPFHIAGIFANMTYAGQVVTILSVFSKVFLMVIALHIITLVIQFFIGGTIAGGNPIRMLKNMIPAYLTAIGTQSSAATIPVTLTQTKKNGVKDDIADFVIPLCATIHLSGSTITLVSCSMAIMMLNGMAISFVSFFPFILMLGITMVAAPGVPGGAIIAALGLLETMLGFPQPMLSLMIALYVAQDSFGTATNVTGDGAIALMVNKISGNKLVK
ncbi:dicarboxylate/amino acid:cation symporter [Tissierella pigra]|uniref:Dicarboxylate/amino acid:cation symporter n=1 Tax=Tissierella pigra TaxID=2607614 RepID=A0A6N7XRY2_9FIRM|nr:dicarboxylate/amino acid:cation symporter [Tissierella pigra]MBU5425397.1 dicarboxylate/amino acid:cation symporter [Tissierella pigra]MSU00517.1 dicarboxylate/amino acid:cation symporter [Tissierella pigra]